MAVSGYQPWVAHNVAVVRDRISLFVKEKKAEIVAKLREVADTIVGYVDNSFTPNSPIPWSGNNQFPIWSANMRDATGVAVYVDGVTNYLKVPNKLAPFKQHTGPSMGNRRNIDGHEFLQKSIVEGASVFNKGIWIVLYCAVPYAAYINASGSKWGRGQGFWNLEKAEFTNAILSRLTQVTPMYGFK